jgi:AcrR family transcriptional regulator
MATPSDTRTHILDTAERLFAARGIDAVGIRALVDEAKVNLAAVHYHFGNREELVRAVIKRRVLPMNAERLRRLDEVEAAAAGSPQLPDILRAFVAPVFELVDEHPHLGWLLAHIDVTPDEKLRMFFYSLFVELVWRYGAALRKAVPSELGDREGWTRVQFTWGAMLFTMAKRTDREVTASGQIEPLPVSQLIDEWVAFCTAGLTCPSPGGSSSGSAARKPGGAESKNGRKSSGPTTRSKRLAKRVTKKPVRRRSQE